METTTGSAKLAELRAKTDRQLVTFIGSRLERALQLFDRNDRPESEKAYHESRALLPLVYGLTGGERRRLERQLAQLRELLDDFSSDAELNMQTACS